MTGAWRRVPRGWFSAAVTWSCAVALIGCTARPGGARHDASSVTILYPGDEHILGPIFGSDEAVRFLVFLPLVGYYWQYQDLPGVATNERGAADGRLAQRWSHSPDLREWTFHLRQNVRWHDGVPVTADDIAFSLDLYRHPAMTWDAPNAYRVRVLDDSTLTITYPRAPRDPFHKWKTFWPKHLLERLDPNQIGSWDFWVHPVGNGPYRYVRHVPQTLLELEANPDFYAGKPRIERVILKFGGGTPITELLSGNVDAVEYFNQADLPRIAADPRFRMYYYIDPFAMTAVFWNHRSPFFRDAMVRQALTLGIDRKNLLAALNLPPDLPIVDALFTGRQYRHHELPAPLPYDPDSASRLLDAAGWRDTDGDEVRERGGQAFRFVALTRGGLMEEKAAVYVQAQLRRIGVRMDVETLEPQAAGRRLRAGDFEAAFFPFLNRIDTGVEWFETSSPIGYTSPRVLALLRAARATGDPDEIDRISRDLMPVLRADVPVTFLFPFVRTYVAHRRIRGLQSPDQADPILQMEHLWLEDGR